MTSEHVPDRAGPPTEDVTLFVARHGEVDSAWRRSIYGRLDVPLSERGREQSRLVAEALAGQPLAFVVSSGLARAEAAAAEVRAARPGLERCDDPRFVELDRGDWAGRAIDDVRAEDPEGFNAWMAAHGAVRAPGGESPTELAERTVPAFRDWARRAAGAPPGARRGLVVAHAWVVRSAVAWSLGIPMERSGALALAPGAIVELAFGAGAPDGPPRLVRYAL